MGRWESSTLVRCLYAGSNPVVGSIVDYVKVTTVLWKHGVASSILASATKLNIQFPERELKCVRIIVVNVRSCGLRYVGSIPTGHPIVEGSPGEQQPESVWQSSSRKRGSILG